MRDIIEWSLIVTAMLLTSFIFGYGLSALFALVVWFPFAVFAATLYVGAFWFLMFAWIHTEIGKLCKDM